MSWKERVSEGEPAELATDHKPWLILSFVQSAFDLRMCLVLGFEPNMKLSTVILAMIWTNVLFRWNWKEL